MAVATLWTLPAEAATGATPSSRNAAMSLRTKNGDPPVASQHAAAKPGSGSEPHPAATSLATPPVVSGRSVTTSVTGSIVTAAISSRPAPASAGRAASNTTTRSSSSRGSRKARKRSDARSAQ